MQVTGANLYKAIIITQILVMLHLLSFDLKAQKKSSLKLLDWRPRSEMVVSRTEIIKPKFPVIDIHNHLGRLENMKTYLKEMDEAGVWISISLDGHSANDFYKEHLEASQKVAKDRLLVFFAPDWKRIDEPGFGEKEAGRLEEAVKLGVRGVKVFKSLGLTLKDKSGKVVPVDDARISELGRQPYTARRFMIKYQDRVLFGTDTPPDTHAYRIYYRFLETDDEYIDPAEGHHLQGRWMIYGLFLPDEVLEKIYYKNAMKILNWHNNKSK